MNKPTNISPHKSGRFRRWAWAPVCINLLMAVALILLTARNKASVQETVRQARRGRALDISVQTQQAVMNLGYLRNQRELRAALSNLVGGSVRSLALLDGKGNTVVSVPTDHVSASTRARVARMRLDRHKQLVVERPAGRDSSYEVLFAFKPKVPDHVREKVGSLLRLLQAADKKPAQIGLFGPSELYFHVIVKVRDSASVRAVQRARNAYVMSWGVGGLLFLLSVGAYVAERRMARLHQASERQSALAEMGEMAAVLAHEIRSPLSAIKGRSQLLLEHRDHLTDETLEGFVEQSARLERLVNELLAYSRPAAPQRSTTTGSLVIEAAMENVTELALAKQVAVVPDVDSGSFRADGDQLTRALTNLLTNALEATPSRGRITVRFTTNPSCACFTVIDDGPGLPSKLGTEMFKPFVTTNHRGTGLGLPIVRRIAEMHGGTVKAWNVEGRGAAFQLELPLDDPNA